MRSAFLALLLATAAHAQSDWSALLPAAGVAVPAADGFEAWEAGPGATVRVEAPAYGGRARAEVTVLAYDPTGDGPGDAPAFASATRAFEACYYGHRTTDAASADAVAEVRRRLVGDPTGVGR